MKRFALAIVAILVTALSFAQSYGPEGETAAWKITTENIEGDLYKVVFTGTIYEGWHTYPLVSENYPTEICIEEISGAELEGEPYEVLTPVEYEDAFGDVYPCYFDKIVIEQKVRVAGAAGAGAAGAALSGYVTWQCCNHGSCVSPEYKEFKVEIAGAAVAVDKKIKKSTGSASGSLWAIILEAILWGFAALLTPCVFPMVPMTVSFFIKGSANPVAGRFQASMYGLFIVLLYTVPISLIIALTWIFGGDAVTADIFNWLSTHWLPNILFFAIFMVFAASFFGAFEITLPSKLVNSSDAGVDKGGLLGIFFMALTLVLVSFSCTGPIVGSVLIKATSGEFWEPMIAMLAFSVAFALPFTVLAFFPSLLKKMPKSGGWLNSVKVVLGFIEIALGFKFLSVADQTYHWGLLDREVVLAIWIVVFALLGFYLLGKLRFKHDDEVPHLSVFRLALAIVVFSFVVYMLPGMWGAPLKALSGYLPPITTQDFVLSGGSTGSAAVTVSDAPKSNSAQKYGLHLPLGLNGYFDLEEGLAAAQAAGKPLFVDITGHGCVNCREMEARVWSDPQVLEMLMNDYVVVALYTDDKQKLAKEDWLTAENGDVYKEMGRKNSYLVRTLWGVNAQPNYVLLSPSGSLLAPVRGYNLDVQGFVEFLKSGLE